MPVENNGVSDDVQAELNPEPSVPNPDAKGPDPAQWEDPEARSEAEFDPADGKVKGPDPAEWGDEARAERGAEIADPAVDEPDDTDEE